MKKMQYLFEFAVLKSICGLFGFMPLSLSGSIWKTVALALCRVLPFLKKTAERNIRMTIGKDWSQSQIDALIRKIFIHCGYFIAEFINTRNLGPDFNSCVTIKGEEHMQAALAQKKGVILVSGHFGNWEVVGHALRVLGYNLHVFYKKMSNPLVDGLFFTYRSRYSEGLIEIGDYKQRTKEVLAKNEIIGIIPDQDARHHGIFVDFLGKPASTYKGPALMSLNFEAPMVAIFFWRDKLGSYNLTFEPIEPSPSDDKQEAIEFLTQQWVAKLENHVVAHPDQYFWLHRRWKTQPE